MIQDPITLGPDQLVAEAVSLMAKYSISGVPITVNGNLVGILTNRDLRFEENFNQPIRMQATLCVCACACVCMCVCVCACVCLCVCERKREREGERETERERERECEHSQR